MGVGGNHQEEEFVFILLAWFCVENTIKVWPFHDGFFLETLEKVWFFQ